MKHSLPRRIALAVTLLLSAPSPSLAQQTPAPPQPPTKPNASARQATPAQQQDRAIERLYAARFSALSTASPETYFLLAEDIADGFETDPARRRVATRLFVLAYEIARAKPDGREIAASACLGLASVSGTARDAQFLSSLARTLDPRQAPPGWVDVPEVATSDSGVYRFAVMLGDVRSGEGLRARRLLEDPDVTSLLDRYDSLLSKSGWDLGTFTIRREAGRWPCPECRNERVTRKVVQGVVEFQICPICNGNLGPSLSTSQVLAQLRFEAWLLQGSQRSWASQMGIDGGLPLVEPDPNRIGIQFGIDTSLVLWRNGNWIADPNAPKPPAPTETQDQPPADAPLPAPPSTPPTEPEATEPPPGS